MKPRIKLADPKPASPLAFYLANFNNHSSAVVSATRAWAIQRMIPRQSARPVRL